MRIIASLNVVLLKMGPHNYDVAKMGPVTERANIYIFSYSKGLSKRNIARMPL